MFKIKAPQIRDLLGKHVKLFIIFSEIPSLAPGQRPCSFITHVIYKLHPLNSALILLVHLQIYDSLLCEQDNLKH